LILHVFDTPLLTIANVVLNHTFLYDSFRRRVVPHGQAGTFKNTVPSNFGVARCFGSCGGTVVVAAAAAVVVVVF
jgi:hypothetical protein